MGDVPSVVPLADALIDEVPLATLSSLDSDDFSQELKEVLSAIDKVQGQCRVAHSTAAALREQKENLLSSTILDEGLIGCKLTRVTSIEQWRCSYDAGTPSTMIENTPYAHDDLGETESNLGIGRTPVRTPNSPDGDKIFNKDTKDVFGNGAASPEVPCTERVAELEAACDVEEEHAMYLEDLEAFLHEQACLIHHRNSRNFVV